MYHRRIKRAFDLIIVVLGAPLWLPMTGAVSLLVWWKLGRPVFFRQIRPGLLGRPFLMLKFRTMTSDVGADGRLLDDDHRLTPFGRWLRESSLDELPELYNVLRGEMSLIGPRPLLMEYLDCYTVEQARRHQMLPGITGWAQVNGRNSLSWEARFKLDTWYVDNHSFWLDLKIMVRTVRYIFKRTGINAPGEATMPKFTRSSPERHHTKNRKLRSDA